MTDGTAAAAHVGRHATAPPQVVTAGRVVDALVRRLQRVLLLAVVGLGGLGWVVAVAGFPVASAALASVLGLGALALAYAAVALGVRGVRRARRRADVHVGGPRRSPYCA